MKIALPTLIAAVAVAGVASTAPAEPMEGHTIVQPPEIMGAGPAALQPGAEAAVLFGDPSRKASLCSGSVARGL